MSILSQKKVISSAQYKIIFRKSLREERFNAIALSNMSHLLDDLQMLANRTIEIQIDNLFSKSTQFFVSDFCKR